MAGLLDFLTTQDPAKQQGLLGAAAALLDAGGPSRFPISTGQGLAAALGAYQKNFQGAQDRQQQQTLYDLKYQDMQSDLANQEQRRAMGDRIAKRIAGLGGAGAMPDSQAPMASAMPGGDMSPKIGGPDWLQNFQQQAGAAPMIPAAGTAPRWNMTADWVEQQKQIANIRLEEGDVDGALKLMEQIEKFQPKVKEYQKVKKNGKVYNQPFFDNGLPGDIGGEEIAQNLNWQDVGPETLGLDPTYGTVVARQKNGVSPNTAANNAVTIRGQNMVDARSREQNQIAAGRKAVDVSTGLRKEFDDLAEVKNYKQALPAYTAIVDAAKRNTTQSDINIVYGLAKLYDPTSVVREGEYATVANSPNIPERVKGYAQYLSGGGRLTDEVKRQILAEANGRMGSYEKPYLQAREGYSKIASQTGADPSQIFPSKYVSPIPAAAPSPAPNIPQRAINHLKLQPSLRAAFDEKYGAGAAASVLGR